MDHASAGHVTLPSLQILTGKTKHMNKKSPMPEIPKCLTSGRMLVYLDILYVFKTNAKTILRLGRIT